MDQPGGAGIRVPAAHDPAGGGVRGRELLRPLRARAARAPRDARVHRHRLHVPRQRRARRRARAHRRPGRRAPRERPLDLARKPVPGHVRAGPRRARHQRGRARPRARGRPRGRIRRGGRALRRGGARAPAAARAAGRRRVPPAPSPHREGRPGEPRQLPGRGRLRGVARGDRHGPRRRHPRGDRLAAPGARRRGVPDRPEVGRRRPKPGPPALPRMQRRRVGARDIQGPDRDRARPVRARRGDDDRRARNGLRAGLRLPPRGVPAGVGAPLGARSTRPALGAFSATT